MMAKICIECENPVWARKRCLRHDKIANPSKYQLKRESVLKATPLIPNSQIKNRIKPISDKMAERLKEYRIVRDKYLKENPICQFPDCSSKELDLHHLKGKIGSLLSDTRYFCGLCRKHHSWVHSNHNEAKQLGLIMDRL